MSSLALLVLLATGGMPERPVQPALALPPSIETSIPVEALATVDLASVSAAQLPTPKSQSKADMQSASKTDPKSDPKNDPWARHIAEAEQRFGIPEPWIRALMEVESGGRATVNGKPIVSRAGAMGLMQVMPDTYNKMRRAHGLGADPHDPRDNILAGTAYLRALHDCFGWPAMYAAYNVGPKRLDDLRRANRPLPAETRRFLAKLDVDLPETQQKRVNAAALVAASATSDQVATQYADASGRMLSDMASEIGLPDCPMQQDSAEHGPDRRGDRAGVVGRDNSRSLSGSANRG